MESSAEKCNICGPVGKRVLGTNGRYTFIECFRCGLQWASPIPSDEELSPHYEGFFAGNGVQREFSRYLELAERSLSHQIEIARSFVAEMTIPGRFLDVGCGGGHYVAAAHKMGWEAYGLEIDRAAVEGAKRLGVKNIYHGSPADVPFSPQLFHVVKAMHVLEHCTDPLAFLQRILRLLHPAGVLIVDVPNQASRVARLKILLRLVGLENDDYGYLQPPTHLFAFSPKTLTRMLEAVDLEVKKVVYTSPLDQLYFPTTEKYYSSPRERFVKFLYRTMGRGSYISIYARKAPVK